MVNAVVVFVVWFIWSHYFQNCWVWQLQIKFSIFMQSLSLAWSCCYSAHSWGCLHSECRRALCIAPASFLYYDRRYINRIALLLCRFRDIHRVFWWDWPVLQIQGFLEKCRTRKRNPIVHSIRCVDNCSMIPKVYCHNNREKRMDQWHFSENSYFLYSTNKNDRAEL